MNSTRPARVASRAGLIVLLLLLSLLLAAVLAFRAQTADRTHRVVAENVLRDYARLAADELVRRATTKVGYEGFYPLITFLKQHAPSAASPPSPAEIARTGDDTTRQAADLVRSTFRFTPERGLETSALTGTVDPTVVEFLTDALAHLPAETPGRRYSTLITTLARHAHTFVVARTGSGPGAPIVGFEAERSALPARLASGLERPLLPPSLLSKSLKNDVLFIRVVDAAGEELLRSGQPREPDLGIDRFFGSDYNGMFAGTVIHAAVDPAAAGALVIGGLPQSRLPALLGLLAVAAGLTLTAMLQLRREWALAALRSEFVAQVSHELRTPLTQIRMFAETLLLDRVRSDAERRRSLEIIDRESRRLDHLVENLLRFSRGERGETRIATETRDVVPLVRQLLVEFEPLAQGRARLAGDLPPTAVADVDEDALRQILLNLLDNAVKYGPAGQEVRVRVSMGDGRLRVEVDDEGPGVPDGEREKIWERFYRIADHRRSAVSGTGIGLSVVRELALLHRGRAWAEAGARGGTRFVVELSGRTGAERAAS